MCHTNEFEASAVSLKDALHKNREIEFALKQRVYIAEPCADPPLPQHYAIWDVELNSCIFMGDIEAMFAFVFPGGFTLNKDFNRFDLLYIY